VINQNGRPQTISGRLRKSAKQVGIPCWFWPSTP